MLDNSCSLVHTRDVVVVVRNVLLVVVSHRGKAVRLAVM